MNTRILTLDDRSHWSPEPAQPGSVDRSFTDLLESCILRCDELAYQIQESGMTHRIYDVLGECVMATGQYLGARERESFLEPQYALLCAEVCDATAALSRTLDSKTAGLCREICRTCAARIRTELAPTLLN